MLLDGREYTHPEYPFGNFMAPTILEIPINQRDTFSVYFEELFGPVLTIIKASTYEQALKIVNTNRWGNGTAIFTTNGYYQRDFATKAAPGQVGVNVPIPVPLPMFSFTGNKGECVYFE